MSGFLTIPAREGLVARGRRAEDEEEDEEEEEEEEEGSAHLIPRCSPVPRRRGPSIADETAEYLRIRLALSRRVSFADAAGGELVDVRRFVPFDSDEEEDGDGDGDGDGAARWEENYRKPSYRVQPEFQPLAGAELARAVSANKVEVEAVSPVPDEPLAFDGLIRVLNLSFHKSVYARATMDGWITHYDHPAEYVPESGSGETDGFRVRLSFSEPYLFDGARIDFVARYETPDGEFWANNVGRNYSVTLRVTYEENRPRAHGGEEAELRGILKPPRYRVEDDYDLPQDKDEEGVASAESGAAVQTLPVVCPVVIEPEIDIEVAEARSVSKTSGGPTPADSSEHPPQESSALPPQTDHSELTGQATEPPEPTEHLTLPIHPPKETRLEVPDDDLSDTVAAEDDVEVSTKPLSPKQEISAKVPSDLDTTSPAMFPSLQNVGEDEPEEVKKGETEEETTESETPRQDEMRDDGTQGSPQVLQESAWPRSSNEKIFSRTSQDTDTLEAHVVKCEATVRSEPSREQEAVLRVEEVSDIVVASTWRPAGVSTRKDIESQSLPAIIIPGVSVHHRRGPEMEMERLSTDTEAPSMSGSSILMSGCKTDAVSLEDEGKNPCSAEELQTLHDVSAPLQNQEGLESQLPLPDKIRLVPSSQPEVMLSQTLIPSFAFFCAAICLAVGFQEPDVFLMGLGLLVVSLCF